HAFRTWKIFPGTGENGTRPFAEPSASPGRCSNSGKTRSYTGNSRPCGPICRSSITLTNSNGKGRRRVSSHTAYNCRFRRCAPARLRPAAAANSLRAAAGCSLGLAVSREHRHLEPLFEHHIGRLQGAFHPTLGVRICLAADVDGRTRRLQDLLFHHWA